ncbi:MAG TPA: hypothetical protein DDZ88_05085 [Verrucomicrobiales bacterium]|nr:hypothetical protein [Verrucomicrobiales bacterium]
MVSSKWKDIAMLHHMDETAGADIDWSEVYDELVAAAAADRPVFGLKKIMDQYQLCLNERYSNETPLTVVGYIENMATMLQSNETVAPPLSPVAGDLLAMVNELDHCLREIRSENLDGSEPALEALLSNSLALRLRAQALADPEEDEPQERERGMSPSGG